MAESAGVDDGSVVHNLLPPDSVKLMGESVGVSNLNDDAAMRLSEDLEYRLKEIIQDAAKFMRQMKRKTLTCADMDHALRAKNLEPLYGFYASEYIPFRHTSGGGKDLYFTEEKEVGLVELVNSPLARLPCDVSIRAHWLCVEGVQPVIPENPPPATLDGQRNEALGNSVPLLDPNDPASKLKKIKFDKKSKKEEFVGTEWSKLKPLQAHALSLEQQLYYKEITEACIGVGAESKCQEALSSISNDPGLYQLLPQFVSFIIEGIKVNISQRNLLALKHLVRMIGALLENSTLLLEKYLHELVPSLISCLINKQVCVRPESDDQWSMRENAAKVLAKMCKKYNSSVNNIQPRVTRILCQALKSGPSGIASSQNQGLAVHFGVMAGLCELGSEAISSLVIPRLKQEGSLIRTALNLPGKPAEHVAANRLQSLLLRYCPTVLANLRPATDTAVQYQSDFGSLGVPLFNQVKSLRQNRMAGGAQSRPLALARNVTTAKTRPPPLNFASVKTSTSAKTQSSPVVGSISSPSIAAALQLVSQATKSNPSTPTILSTPSSAVNLLSVISSPGASVLAEQISAALTGSSNGGAGGGRTGMSVVKTSGTNSRTSSSPSPKLAEPKSGSNSRESSAGPSQKPEMDIPSKMDTT